MNEWKAKRSELEQQLIDAKQTVIKYEGTFDWKTSARYVILRLYCASAGVEGGG
nr:hypothetical protein P5640_24620 [Bacillus subtilis]